MKILSSYNLARSLSLWVMVSGMLCFFSPIAKAFPTGDAEKQNLQLHASDDGSQHYKPYVPVHRKNAGSQTETELRAEENDSTEKDNGEETFELIYSLNKLWVRISPPLRRTLFRITETNHLYILYHSWKAFLL